ncbi:MAG TPA: hypothetical protein PKE66_10650 [Pyrinomonadaceae bacterium]|nr:hypothetical protein [Pyrinomonadaceae bacterium]
MNRKVIYTVLLFLILLLGAAGLFSYVAFFDRNHTITLASNVAINADWSELKTDTPFKPSKQVHDIVLIVEGLSFDPKRKEFVLPSGEAIDPELELIDTANNVYRLQSGSGSAGDYDSNAERFRSASMSFRLVNDNLPSSVQFQTIRIRSDIPFRCSRVNWHNWRMK